MPECPSLFLTNLDRQRLSKIIFLNQSIFEQLIIQINERRFFNLTDRLILIASHFRIIYIAERNSLDELVLHYGTYNENFSLNKAPLEAGTREVLHFVRRLSSGEMQTYAENGYNMTISYTKIRFTTNFKNN